MPSCVAFNCVKRTDGRGSKVSLFCFPHHDKARMRRWVSNINRKNWKPSPNSRICALHFTEECFHTGRGRTKLNSTAVPTIFAFPGVNTTFKTQVVSMHQEVSDTVYFDHPYCCTAVSSPSTSGGVTTSTEVTNAVDLKYCSTAVTTKQKGGSFREVLDGHESTAHHNVTLEQHTAVSNTISATAESPHTQFTWAKLHSKIQKVEKQLVTCRKCLKFEKQKTRRLKKRIFCLTEVIQDLKQKMKNMRKDKQITTSVPRPKGQSHSKVKQ